MLVLVQFSKKQISRQEEEPKDLLGESMSKKKKEGELSQEPSVCNIGLTLVKETGDGESFLDGSLDYEYSAGLMEPLQSQNLSSGLSLISQECVHLSIPAMLSYCLTAAGGKWVLNMNTMMDFRAQ